MAIHPLQTRQTSTLQEATNVFLSAVRPENEQEGQEDEALLLLTTYLRDFGTEFIELLDHSLSQQGHRDIAVATTLTVLGRVEHPKSQSIRLKLLEKSLSSRQVGVRDGAVAGLGYLMSKDAIPALEISAKVETNRHLRRSMEQLLKTLKQS